MAYQILVSRKAQKDIDRLDTVVKKRVKKAILNYSCAPISRSKKLFSSTIGTRRFRIGNYRVIFDIVKNDLIILKIGHRKDIYRKS